MNVCDIMTRNVYMCRPTDSLAHAARLMNDHDCGCIPVIDAAGRVVGIVTDRDICMTVLGRGERLADLSVTEAMTREVFCAHPDESLDEIETMMSQRQVRRVPVVDDEGYLCGILSLNDIAVAMTNFRRAELVDGIDAQSVATTLSKICAHRPLHEIDLSSVTAH